MARDAAGPGDGRLVYLDPPVPFTREQRYLRAGIPDDFRGDCVPGVADGVLKGNDDVAAIECHPNLAGVSEVSYFLTSPSDGVAAFKARMKAQGVTRDGGDCSAGRPGMAKDGIGSIGCFRDSERLAQLRLLLGPDCPTVYVAVYGSTRNLARLYGDFTSRYGYGWSSPVGTEYPGSCPDAEPAPRPRRTPKPRRDTSAGYIVIRHQGHTYRWEGVACRFSYGHSMFEIRSIERTLSSYAQVGLGSVEEQGVDLRRVGSARAAGSWAKNGFTYFSYYPGHGRVRRDLTGTFTLDLTPGDGTAKGSFRCGSG